MKKNIYLFLGIILLFASCSKSIYNPKSPEYSPIVELETTFGNIEIQLYATTPLHRDNFVKLVKKGYYDSLLFHRVINKFMIQGGDPDSKNAPASQMLGNGGPGYTIPAEFVDSNLHIKGALAAARMGDGVNPKRASSGSQFYLVQGQKVKQDMLDMVQNRNNIKYTDAQKKAYKELGGTPHLDGAYTVFGRVIKGLEIIDEIAKQPTGAGSRPVKDILMKIRIKKG